MSSGFLKLSSGLGVYVAGRLPVRWPAHTHTDLPEVMSIWVEEGPDLETRETSAGRRVLKLLGPKDLDSGGPGKFT
jgi:hypothetical protein